MKKQLIALISAIVVLLGIFIAKPLVFDKANDVEPTTTTEWFDENAITTERTTYETRKATTKTTTQKKTTKQSSGTVDKDSSYYSKNDVALYIHTYGRLPNNFITKNQARALGWEGGSVEKFAPGKAIGGDYYGNYEGKLPSGNYHECDINTHNKSSRGAERIIYSSDGRIYYTSNHYESFTQLY